MSEPYVTSENLKEKTLKWMEIISRRNIHKWPFDIGNAALLVIDMQKYFLEEREHGYCCGGVAVLENVQKLIAHFRKHKRPIVFTRHAHKKDGSDLGILGKWWSEMPVDGTKEAEIDPRMAPPAKKGTSTEFIITKNRYSAFYNTVLDDILKKFNIKDVVITGVMTNICCESTARDAFFRDYMVRFVADATGSVKEEMHVGTLLNLAYAFADICTTGEILQK
ncbi:MAG: isochorismatase family protein [Deltaproteobacteria bacterium]|nr:isochorismatase family protein [Deltaproteobacteria bacterium]